MFRWLTKLFQPKARFLNQWRCTRCAAEGAYEFQLGPGQGQNTAVLNLKCTRDRSNDQFLVACPLIPIDSRGKEIPLDELI